MKLQDYLERIGHDGGVRRDLATFKALHRAHAQNIPYENLDVQLGAPVTRDAKTVFEKIVTRRRGGWCYEMNGLLGWALRAIGFDVKFLAGGVTRDVSGDTVVGNHLVLLVDIDGEPWVGDVGFGDGLIDPVPLREGAADGHPLQGNLTPVGDGWWRYANDPRTGGPKFDFNPAVGDESLLERHCAFLQTDPSSPFVQNAVVQRWRGAEHLSLRGRVLRRLTLNADRRSLVNSAEEYVAALRDEFGIDFPEAARLWPQIESRHAEIFAGKDPLAGR